LVVGHCATRCHARRRVSIAFTRALIHNDHAAFSLRNRRTDAVREQETTDGSDKARGQLAWNWRYKPCERGIHCAANGPITLGGPAVNGQIYHKAHSAHNSRVLGKIPHCTADSAQSKRTCRFLF